MPNLQTIEESLSKTLDEALSGVSSPTKGGFPTLERLQQISEEKDSSPDENAKRIIRDAGKQNWERSSGLGFGTQTLWSFLETATLGATKYIAERPEAETFGEKAGATIGGTGGFLVGFGKVKAGLTGAGKLLGMTKVAPVVSKATKLEGTVKKIDAGQVAFAGRVEKGVESIFDKYGVSRIPGRGISKNLGQKALYRRVLHGDKYEPGMIPKLAGWQHAFRTVGARNDFTKDVLRNAGEHLHKFGAERGIKIGKEVFDKKSGQWVNSAADDITTFVAEELRLIGGRPLGDLQNVLAAKMGDKRVGTYLSHVFEEAMIFAGLENIIHANAVLAGEDGAEWNQMGEVTKHAVIAGLTLGTVRFIPGGIAGVGYVNKPGREKMKMLFKAVPSWAKKYKMKGKDSQSYTSELYRKGQRASKGSIEADRAIVAEQYKIFAPLEEANIAGRLRTRAKAHPRYNDAGRPIGFGMMRGVLENSKNPKAQEAVAEIMKDGLDSVSKRLFKEWKGEYLNILGKDLWQSKTRMAAGAFFMTGPGVLFNEEVPLEDKLLSLTTGFFLMKHGKGLSYRGGGKESEREWKQDALMTGYSKDGMQFPEDILKIEQMHNALGGKIDNPLWQKLKSKALFDRNYKDISSNMSWGPTFTAKGEKLNGMISWGPKNNKFFIKSRKEYKENKKKGNEFTPLENEIYDIFHQYFDKREILADDAIGLKERKELSPTARGKFKKAMKDFKITDPSEIQDLKAEIQAPQIQHSLNKQGEALFEISMGLERNKLFPLAHIQKANKYGNKTREILDIDHTGVSLTNKQERSISQYQAFARYMEQISNGREYRMSSEVPMKLKRTDNIDDLVRVIDYQLDDVAQTMGYEKLDWIQHGQAIGAERALYNFRKNLHFFPKVIKDAWNSTDPDMGTLQRLIKEEFAVVGDAGRIYDVSDVKVSKANRPLYELISKTLDLETGQWKRDGRVASNIRKAAKETKQFLPEDAKKVKHENMEAIKEILEDKGIYNVNPSQWRKDLNFGIDAFSDWTLHYAQRNSRMSAPRVVVSKNGVKSLELFDRPRDLLIHQALVDSGALRPDSNSMPRIVEDFNYTHASAEYFKSIPIAEYIRQRTRGEIGPRLTVKEAEELKLFVEVAEAVGVDPISDLMPMIDKHVNPMMLRTEKIQGKEQEVGYIKTIADETYVMNRTTMYRLIGELQKINEGIMVAEQNGFIREMSDAIKTSEDSNILERGTLLMEMIAKDPSSASAWIALKNSRLMDSTSKQLKWDAEKVRNTPEKIVDLLQETIDLVNEATMRNFYDPTAESMHEAKRIALEDGTELIVQKHRTFDELDTTYNFQDMYGYKPTEIGSKSQQFQGWFYEQNKYKPKKGKKDYQWNKFQKDLEKHIVKRAQTSKQNVDKNELARDIVQVINNMKNNRGATEYKMDSRHRVTTKKDIVLKDSPYLTAEAMVMEGFDGKGDLRIISHPNFKDKLTRDRLIKDGMEGWLTSVDERLHEPVDTQESQKKLRETSINDRSMHIDVLLGAYGVGRPMLMNTRTGESKFEKYISEQWIEKHLNENIVSNLRTDLMEGNFITENVDGNIQVGNKKYMFKAPSSVEAHRALSEMKWDLVYNELYGPQTWSYIKGLEGPSLAKKVAYFKQSMNRTGFKNSSEGMLQTADYLRKSEAKFETDDFMVHVNRGDSQAIDPANNVPYQYTTDYLADRMEVVGKKRSNELWIEDVLIHKDGPDKGKFMTGENGQDMINPSFSARRRERIVRNEDRERYQTELVRLKDIIEDLKNNIPRERLGEIGEDGRIASRGAKEKNKNVRKYNERIEEFNEIKAIHEELLREIDHLTRAIQGKSDRLKDQSTGDGATYNHIDANMIEHILLGNKSRDFKQGSGIKEINTIKHDEGSFVNKQGTTEADSFVDEIFYGEKLYNVAGTRVLAHKAPKAYVYKIRYLSQLKPLGEKVPDYIVDSLVSTEIDVNRTDRTNINETEWDIRQVLNYSEDKLIPFNPDTQTLVFVKDYKNKIKIPPNEMSTFDPRNRDAINDYYNYIKPSNGLQEAQTDLVETLSNPAALKGWARHDIQKRYKNRTSGIDETNSYTGVQEKMIIDYNVSPTYFGNKQVLTRLLDDKVKPALYGEFKYGGDAVTQPAQPKLRTVNGQIRETGRLREELSSERLGYISYAEVLLPRDAKIRERYDPDNIQFVKPKDIGKDETLHINAMKNRLDSYKWRQRNPDLVPEYEAIIEMVKNESTRKFGNLHFNLKDLKINPGWKLLLKVSRNPKYNRAGDVLVIVRGFNDNNTIKVGNGTASRRLQDDFDIDNLIWVNSAPESAWKEWEKNGAGYRDIKMPEIPLERSSAKNLRMNVEQISRFHEKDKLSDIYKGTSMNLPRQFQNILFPKPNRQAIVGEIRTEGPNKGTVRASLDSEGNAVELTGIGFKTSRNTWINVDQNYEALRNMVDRSTSQKVQPAVDAKKQYDTDLLKSPESIRNDVFFKENKVFTAYGMYKGMFVPRPQKELQPFEQSLAKLYIENYVAPILRAQKAEYGPDGSEIKKASIMDIGLSYKRTMLRLLGDLNYEADKMAKEYYKKDYKKWKDDMKNDTIFGDLNRVLNPEAGEMHKNAKARGDTFADMRSFLPEVRDMKFIWDTIQKANNLTGHEGKVAMDVTVEYTDALSSFRNKTYKDNNSEIKKLFESLNDFKKLSALQGEQKKQIDNLYGEVVKIPVVKKRNDNEMAFDRREKLIKQIDNAKKNLKEYNIKLNTKFQDTKMWTKAYATLLKNWKDILRDKHKNDIKNGKGLFAGADTNKQIEKILKDLAKIEIGKKVPPYEHVQEQDFISMAVHQHLANSRIEMAVGSLKYGPENLEHVDRRIRDLKKWYAKERKILEKNPNNSRFRSDNYSSAFELLQRTTQIKVEELMKSVAGNKYGEEKPVVDDMTADLVLSLLSKPMGKPIFTKFRGAIHILAKDKYFQDMITLADRINFEGVQHGDAGSISYAKFRAANYNHLETLLREGDMAMHNNHLPKDQQIQNIKENFGFIIDPKRIETLHQRQDFSWWMHPSRQKFFTEEFGALDTWEQLSVYYNTGGGPTAPSLGMGRIHSVINPRYSDKPYEQGVHTIAEMFKANEDGALGIRLTGRLDDTSLREAFFGNQSDKNLTPYKTQTLTEKIKKQIEYVKCKNKTAGGK